MLVGFNWHTRDLNWSLRPWLCENSEYRKPVEKNYPFLVCILAMWGKRVVISKKDSLAWYSVPIVKKFTEFSHRLGQERPTRESGDNAGDTAKQIATTTVNREAAISFIRISCRIYRGMFSSS